jgi:hypothetical protein
MADPHQVNRFDRPTFIDKPPREPVVVIQVPTDYGDTTMMRPYRNPQTGLRSDLDGGLLIPGRPCQ